MGDFVLCVLCLSTGILLGIIYKEDRIEEERERREKEAEKQLKYPYFKRRK